MNTEIENLITTDKSLIRYPASRVSFDLPRHIGKRKSDLSRKIEGDSALCSQGINSVNYIHAQDCTFYTSHRQRGSNTLYAYFAFKLLV